VELIGREQEMTVVTERLAKRRLVTLIGPAGIGKTTLAMAVAELARPEYELGVHVVDLTRVDSPDAVAGALAGQLGFSSFDDLITTPGEQPALLVVDNCEHVTAAAADAIATLLAACRAPTVLATSRSPLDVVEESIVVVGPLGVPSPNTSDTDNDAVRLFLERARDAGVSIADDQIDAVAALCRHLDGVPLAIELAAAQTRTMQPAEILARLGKGVDVLARPRFRGHRRHQSLAATIEWSFRLLPADVVPFFERLGVFAGPFTADMANAVGADVELDHEAAGQALRLLVDSSLVAAEPTGGAMRFRLLETVRSFAIDRLRERGTLDDARSRLADHVVRAAADILVEGGTRWDSSVFTRLLSLYDNIVTALRWCLANDDDGRRAQLLCAVLWGVVHQGHTDEIAELCEQTMARWPDTTTPFAADAAATTATARVLTGDLAGAYELAAAALAAGTSSPMAPVTLRRAMAYAVRARHDRTGALPLFAEVSTQARARGLLALALEADVSRAQLLADGGDVATALELARAAQAEAAAAGSAVNEVGAQSVVAHLTLRGDRERGLAAVSDALDAARRISYPAAITVNLRSLAWGLTLGGRHREAARVLAEMYDSLLARSGVADVRGALLTTAQLFHEVGIGAWDQLAATAAVLPAVGPTGSSLDALLELPAQAATPLERRDAIALARRELRRYLESTADDGAPVQAHSGSTARTTAPAGTEPSTPAPVGVQRPSGRLVDGGDYWDIEFAGRSVHVKSSKGLADIGRLLGAPGREIHCLELMGAGVEQGSTGEAVDDTARRQYEHRIRELQADIDDADRDNDYARADRAREELDTLVDHLTAALGLGGRGRRAGGSAERARSAVTQRIRSTVRRLASSHPELGRHLEVSITTGTYCVYRPEHPVDWQVRA
jgi:predicted ATPase